ncbi:general vesicular transport factor p115-like isoform X1 [Dinothrombium tinctorium]|uniref:General vesicular transport factor p115-like isoform X1 n=1 Tax=Dinothrombium tinctorium TaxID=1965070 RepID=A0A3S3QUM5_9ACAR|nr:general vesicular transport factor p115-like isoform X1 [Dinothrombium tinctorium]RWS16287.1 general vesicular transport factor p115-like isoform X1 [Dinothrombium tinctorium]
MDFLKSGWKSVVGSQDGQSQPSVAETIEKLIERVQTSTLLEDRRDACRALKSLSRTYRLEVGAQGMETLINVLETDKNDSEIISYVLDTLNSIISGPIEDPIDYIEGSPNEKSEDLGQQFTEIFAKRKENVSLLIDLLEEFDFKVRWPALRLLMGLLRNKLRDLQERILANPMGISRLMDLLSDSREIIRNDAIILFVHLTRGNSNIQKIVAFENAFDKLFEIIAGEGYSDGGVVVEDCLIVFQNLLKNNTSNQNFFKEGSYIQRLLPFIDITNDTQWPTQKSTNVLFLLQVIRTLVSPRNPLQVTNSCQKVMHQCGVLEKLCAILLTSGVPAEILTETISTVAEVIRGNHHNQEYFSNVTAPSNPPKSVIVILLMSMVNEKQPFDLRCAVLYCFQCFLHKNEFGQAQIIQTLLPNSTDASGLTGQLLCGGLFSADPFSSWLAATALSHALVDNETQKEQLLRVQLSTDSNIGPVSLLQQCCTMLQQSAKLQTRIGLLMLLCHWLSNCSFAVTNFLNIPTNIPYLTSQAGLAESDDLEIVVQGLCAFVLGLCVHFNDDSIPSFTREDLCNLIIKRIGVETFLDKISSISKSEKYSLASQRPQLRYSRVDDVVFDYEFCRLFKSLEGAIIKAVQNKPDLTNGPESNMSAEQHRLLVQYKEVIRDQDQQLTSLRSELEKLRENFEKVNAELKEQSDTCQQLRDQNALLKAQKSSSSLPSMMSDEANISRIQDLKRENESLTKQVRNLQIELARYKSSSPPVPETKINIGDDEEDDSSSVNSVKKLSEEIEALKSELEKEREAKLAISAELDTATKEQEELLDLLSDQQLKATKYRKRLKELGEKLDDDGFDDDDEDIEATENLNELLNK